MKYSLRGWLLLVVVMAVTVAGLSYVIGTVFGTVVQVLATLLMVVASILLSDAYTDRVPPPPWM